jgi:hypothetical protein
VAGKVDLIDIAGEECGGYREYMEVVAMVLRV